MLIRVESTTFRVKLAKCYTTQIKAPDGAIRVPFRPLKSGYVNQLLLEKAKRYRPSFQNRSEGGYGSAAINYTHKLSESVGEAMHHLQCICRYLEPTLPPRGLSA